MKHELRTHPEPFEAMRRGWKHHEVRKNDRRFETGDELWLREWVPETRGYTGREMLVWVSYVTRGGTWGLPPNIDVLSIERVSR